MTFTKTLSTVIFFISVDITAVTLCRLNVRSDVHTGKNPQATSIYSSKEQKDSNFLHVVTT